ncbi:MAG: ABC transporter ATP-binding protein [Mariprofundales bacterium]|nr:ABC transporter ATP-binding protein [Mariprofundales bacterium]
MLEVCNLSLSVPINGEFAQAVHAVSFRLEPGKVFALVGESGCGKSLTAQALLRLGEHQGVRRDSGDILLNGDSIFSFGNNDLRAMRGGRVAMVFQEPMTALNPVFTIGSQLIDVIRTHLPLNKRQARERAIGLLADVELEAPAQLLNQYPGELSGGMRQRVLIAMALSANADYLIADEPTTALDVSVQKNILALLRRLQHQRNLALLLVTHNFGVVAEMADSVAVMYAGEIVEQSDVHTLFDHAAHPYTRALMACRPELTEKKGRLPMIEGQVPAPGAWPQGCHFADRCRHVAADCRAAPLSLSTDHHAVRCLHPHLPKSPT